MKFVEQGHEILFITPHSLQLIESAGRTCYKSKDRITKDSSYDFMRMLLNKGHESVLEHAIMTVKFVTNRGVTHELVRHRLASYSQESTRYVKYDNIEFIMPIWCSGNEKAMAIFSEACNCAEILYAQLIEVGWRPEQAREVLPNAVKTEIVVTANFREWRHIFRERTSSRAHPQIRSLMQELQKEVRGIVPIVFD